MLLTVGGGLVAIPAFTALSLYFDSVPIFMVPTLEQFGILSGSAGLWRLLWQLVFYPLELLMYGLPILLMTLSSHFLTIQLGIMKLFINQLR